MNKKQQGKHLLFINNLLGKNKLEEQETITNYRMVSGPENDANDYQDSDDHLVSLLKDLQDMRLAHTEQPGHHIPV